MKYQVIIPAAGQGKRMKAGRNKLLLELEGRPILIHTLEIFERDTDCEEILLAVHADDKESFEKLTAKHRITKVRKMVLGGKERQHSVYNALKSAENNLMVLVHDGARPFVTGEVIKELVKKAGEMGASIAAAPVKDTIKKAAEGIVQETIERSSLWQVQTPQAFCHSLLMGAHQRAEEDSFTGTDDASLVERLGEKVGIVESDYDNIKITTPEDLYFAEAILAKRRQI
ncbi:2-C-methyl-D-erythritol 4-phosphate cytidylyltransferase [Rossellomorea vietnamensis]|uniref:2-C-methyl-D-erythritol 4-phosphate cytidylyltransferase n=1 Tax=Rossellomorea vietnamensis TaxID=218284 RepID=A0A5D4M7K4_9BACI|nr:2-C-methyl-D-erythritol 4-phosphate cytidylyltransferase [Rossellomorea vietnamensis]TYR97501.1 2-C-methyl-D-erythritol 4-phosphate cytidylyltransferase [Rossellomorea vietnamensis]